MIPSIPSSNYLDNVTIYQDTDSDYKFYVIPDAPELRYGDDGKPVFLFLKYRFDPSTMGDNAPAGGGYLAFDADLGIPAAKLADIKSKLQAIVNQNYQNRGNPPQVELATLPWYEDATHKASVQVAILGQKTGGTGMVTTVVGGGEPSLLGSNVATFSASLNQQGAELLWQACQMAEMPIQIYYDVNFLAQIPALQITGWMHTSQLHAYYESVSEAIDDPDCGSDTDEQYSRYMQENFSKWGVAEVNITDWPDMGSDPTAAGQFKTQMIQEVWSLLEDQLKNDMKDKFDPVAAADKGQAGDYQSTVRSYLQTTNTDLTLYMKRQSVVPWPAHPQATLRGLFGTPGPDGKIPNKADYFKEIDLDDPFFQMLQVHVRCNADFDQDPIFSVKVHIEYGDKMQDLVFTDAKSMQIFQAFIQPSLGRKYQYWTEVSYKNSDKTVKSSTITTNETQLILSVKDFGYLKLQVFAGSVNWDMIDSAQIHIRYGDDANQVPLVEEVVLLNKATTAAPYQRLIWAPVTKPYEYQANFFLKDGQKVTQEWQSYISLQLIVNDMFEDHLAVKLLASGGWDRVSKIVVDVDYEDTANAYAEQKTFELTKDQDYLTWALPLYKGGPQDFRYRQVIVYQDGHTTDGGLVNATGSQTLMVGPVFADYLVVNIVPDLIDFTAVKLVKVSLHYTDAANKIDASEDFVFTKDKKSSATWKYGILDKTNKQYTYTVTYFLADNSQRQTPPTTVSDDTIVLQVPAAAAVPAQA